MTYENKKENNKWKDRNQIGEKMRILSASSKIWKTSKHFDKDLRQLFLSAKKNKKEEIEKGNKEETTTKSNLLKWTVREKKRHWIKQQKPTWNRWKRSYRRNLLQGKGYLFNLIGNFSFIDFKFWFGKGQNGIKQRLREI